MIGHDLGNTTRSRSDRLALVASDLQNGAFRKDAAPLIHLHKTGNQ